MKHRVIGQPSGGSVGHELLTQLQDSRWDTFRAVVAFVKASGVKHVAHDLYAFAGRSGADVRVTAGLSGQVTSLEGLQDLWRLLDGRGQLFAFEEGLPASIFHPKAFLFRNQDEAVVIAGSNNLTQGGLFNNHELSTITSLDMRKKRDAAFVAAVEAVLDQWQTPSSACKQVTAQLLQDLHDQGDLPSELATRVARRQARAVLKRTTGTPLTPKVVFGKISSVLSAPQPKALPTGLPSPPVTPNPVQPAVTPAKTPTAPAAGGPTPQPSQSGATTAAHYSVLLMEVRPHHNGEVFLSYRAVQDDPAFFGHPFSGWSVPRSASANAYPMATPDPIVEIVVYDNSGNVLRHKPIHGLNVVDYVLKHEIRITMPDGIQGDIPQMSLLVMTKAPSATLDYRLEFHPPGSNSAAAYAPQLTNTLPAGGAAVGRRYGWI